MASKEKKTSEVARVGRFGLVGIINTVLDFAIENFLHFALSFSPVVAGVISGTIAMINSFFLNQRFTFKAKKTEPKKVVYFFAITLFGIYVIRSLILKLLTEVWLWPAQTVYTITHALHLPFSQQFVTNNFALGVAIFVVLFYNYIMYKKFVFDA